MSIFEQRIKLKPFEYDFSLFKKAVQKTHWDVSKFSFTSDIQQFKHHLNDAERECIKRAALAISQVEIGPKKFWANIDSRLRKAEVGQIGAYFAVQEVVHMNAYSELIDLLNLNNEFENLLSIKAIKGRVDYLNKYIGSYNNVTDKQFLYTLILFSIFTENVSLFGQFLILKYFFKHHGFLKDIDNVVNYTAAEEEMHAGFGFQLVDIIRREHPEMFDEELEKRIANACDIAIECERNIVSWMFEKGDLEGLSGKQVNSFVVNRMIKSMNRLGFKMNNVPEISGIESLKWFDEDVKSVHEVDFFNTKPTDYVNEGKEITMDDIFGE